MEEESATQEETGHAKVGGGFMVQAIEETQPCLLTFEIFECISS